METDESKNQIVQYNQSVVNSRVLGRIKGQLTRDQRISWYVFLKKAREVLVEKPNVLQFKIDIKEFCELAGFTYKNYYTYLLSDNKNSLKNSLKKLQTTRYQFEFRDRKTDKLYRVMSMTLLSFFDLDEDKKHIIFEFPKFIRDVIFNYHNGFYIIYLPVVRAMRSGYSIALYEQIVERKKFGIWNTSLQDLRDLLGVGKDQYSTHKDFENWAIKPAVSEINEIMGIDLSYKKIKSGRRIVAYEFHWNPKKVKNNIEDELIVDGEIVQLSEEVQELQKIIPELSADILNSSITRYGMDKVKEAVQYIKAQKQKSNIENVNAYLLSLLKNGIFDIQTQKERAKRKEKYEEHLKRIEDRDRKESEWWERKIDEKIKTMTPEEKAQIRESVKRLITDDLSPEHRMLIFRNRVKTLLQQSGITPPENL